MVEEWRKISGTGAEYSVSKKEGHTVLRVKFTFNPKLESPKDFVQKTTIIYENRPDNIYYIFRKAFVSKDRQKWDRIKKNLVKVFPSDTDRERYFIYLNVHKSEIDKYAKAVDLNDFMNGKG